MSPFRGLRPLRLAAAVAAVAAALAAAGCGGGAGAGSATVDGASLVPASAPVFLSLDTRVGAAGWRRLDALLARFPAGRALRERLLAALSRRGLDLERDVEPALGPETDVALLDLPAMGEPSAVLLTRPSQPDKLEALLRAAQRPPAWKVVDSWYVVAQSQATLDRALRGAEQAPLSSVARFEEAFAALPDSALARLYLDGSAFASVFRRGRARGDGGAALALGALGGGLETAAVGVTPEEGGLRLEGVLETAGDDAPPLHEAQLASLVPADALAYVSFGGLADRVATLLGTLAGRAPRLAEALARLERRLGVSVERDLLPILAGEAALYVRAGAPAPEVTLLLSPQDPQKALAVLDELAGRISALARARGASAPSAIRTDTIAGQPVRELVLGARTLFYGLVEGHLVITTAAKGIADLAAGGASLAASPKFERAKAAAGLPDATSGFVYVDLARTVGALERAGLRPAGEQARANLEPLDYLLGYAAGGARQTPFAAFIGIK